MALILIGFAVVGLAVIGIFVMILVESRRLERMVIAHREKLHPQRMVETNVPWGASQPIEMTPEKYREFAYRTRMTHSEASKYYEELNEKRARESMKREAV